MLNQLLTHTPLLYLVQSFWRDEAFSVLAAKESLPFIFTRLGFEPPLYYTMLHFWIKLFGTSELAARSLSMVGFLLATVIIIEWADELYKKHWLAWFMPLFFFVNPMLLYYAFEVRTYGWYIFFATAMLYTYAKKRWGWFIASAVLGFYTHVYILPFFGALFLHRLYTERHHLFQKHRSFLHTLGHIVTDPGVKSTAIAVLLMIPWLIRIVLEMGRMKSSWYFPVDVQLVKSVLGNMFMGYEGTPWFGWKYTRYLSLGIVLIGWFAFARKTVREHVRLLLFFGLVPLAGIIGISFIKPLFVNRYLIPVTVAEVLVIIAAIAAIRRPILQKIAAFVLFAGVLWINWWYAPYHAKPPVRETFEQVQALMKPGDVVMASDSLIYLETLYYTKDKSKVYLYNPNDNIFPWYIGDALITPSRMVRDYPIYPTRAFFIHTDGKFDVVYRMPL